MTNKRTIRTIDGLSLEGHLVDNSVWRSYLQDRTIVEISILLLDKTPFLRLDFRMERLYLEMTLDEKFIS